MPPRPRRAFRSVRSGGRRRTTWADYRTADNAVASGTVTLHDVLQNFVTAGGSREGLTVMRVIGQLAYAPASIGGFMDFGLQTGWSDEASGTDIDPSASPYQDWMLNRRVYPTSSGATVDGTVPFTVDNKSRRRIEHLQKTLFFVWKPTDTGTSSLSLHLRILVALP